MTLLDILVLFIALLVVFFGKVSVLVALLVALLVMGIIRLARGERL